MVRYGWWIAFLCIYVLKVCCLIEPLYIIICGKLKTPLPTFLCPLLPPPWYSWPRGTELYCNSMLRVTFSDLVTNIWIYNLWHPIVKGTQLPWHLWKLSQRDRRLHKLQSLWFPQLPLCSYSPNLADSKARRWSTHLPFVSGHSFLKVKSSAAAYSHIGLQHIRRLWWIPQNTWLCKSYTEPGLEERGCVIVIPQHSHFLQGHSNSWNITPSHGIRPKDTFNSLVSNDTQNPGTSCNLFCLNKWIIIQNLWKFCQKYLLLLDIN